MPFWETKMPARTLLVVAVVVLIGAIALFGYDSFRNEEAMSVTEQRAAENDPEVVLETETEPDETLAPSVAEEETQVEVPVAEGEDSAGPDAADVLTVEGYDPQRVRFLLQESDLPVELRNDYITRLDTAAEDDDALAAVLRQLREDLDAG